MLEEALFKASMMRVRAMPSDLSERLHSARRRWKTCLSFALFATLAATTGCGGGSNVDASSATSGGSSSSGGETAALASAKTIAPASVAAGDTILVSCVLVDVKGELQQPAKDVEQALVFTPVDSVQTDESGNVIAVRAGAVDVRCEFPALGLGDPTGASITITPGPVASVDTTLDTTSVVAGGDVKATCTAYDAFGNVVPDAKPTLTSTPMDGGNVLSGLQGKFTHAGLYDVACEVPGAEPRPVELEVVPGLPAAIVISPVPTKALYPVGSVVSVKPLVTDEYDNPIINAPVAYTSAPSASSTLGNNHFQYLTGGFYDLTATVAPPTKTGEPLTASTQIEVGGVGPAIDCDSPLDGAMLNVAPGSSVNFGGSVHSPNGGVTVTVNGTAASIAGETFSAPITTRFGINFAEIVATDKNGAESTRTCSFLVANQWAPETQLYADTIDLKLTQTAVDDGNRNNALGSFADILHAVANSAGLVSTIDTGLKAANPLKASGCDSQSCTFLGCVCWYSSGIEYKGVSLPGPQTVSLTLVNGGLTAKARIPNAAINLRVHGDVGPVPYDTTGWVTFSYLDVTMTLDTKLSGGKPHVSLRPNTLSTSVGTVSTAFSGVDGWIINNVVTPLAQGPLQNALKSQVQSYLSNNFNTMIDGVLSGLDISTLGASFNVPRLDGSGNIPLSFGLGFSSLSTTASRMLVGISSKLTAPAGQAIPSLGIAIPTGTVLDDPTVSAPQSAAVAVHVGVINQALHALWRGGMFNATLSGDKLGAGLPATASAKITTQLPPVAEIKGSAVELSLGALELSVAYPGLFGGTDPGGNPLPPLQVELGARATATPTLVGNDLHFGNLVITELHFSSGNVALDAQTNQVLSSLLQKIVQNLVNQSLNNALPALPIPSFHLPASLQPYGVGPGDLGLVNMSLGFDARDFVLRGQLGVK
ncbi:Hypothetical protein A7982_01392 [Minicystis rosea]|nr:Hypothetical protein A7982_01392 [Minicystis rosea]